MIESPKLPSSLEEATIAFESSQMVNEAFGSVIQKHYANFGRQSLRAASTVVTDFERRILLLDI